MNQDQVIALMQGSKSEAEWNANIAKVKAAFGGGYPQFWYTAMLQSGLADKIAASFGAQPGITVSSMISKPLQVYGRPTEMPRLGKDEIVVGVYDQGLGEKRARCNNLADMQSLYDSYARGMALTLKWTTETASQVAFKH
ncbi:MAG: hypothetical protein RLZZ67_461 [Candidatus Parcubacteria bacterium]|jgi:hypothetical protein